MPQLPSVRNLLRRIELHPDDPQLYQLLGSRYFRQGELQKAKKAYSRSLKLAPRDAWTHLYLGKLHQALDQHRKALYHFKIGARLRPDLSIVFVCLADAYAGLGIDALATENYLRALDVDPTNECANRKWRKWEESSQL